MCELIYHQPLWLHKALMGSATLNVGHSLGHTAAVNAFLRTLFLTFYCFVSRGGRGLAERGIVRNPRSIQSNKILPKRLCVVSAFIIGSTQMALSGDGSRTWSFRFQVRVRCGGSFFDALSCFRVCPVRCAQDRLIRVLHQCQGMQHLSFNSRGTA